MRATGVCSHPGCYHLKPCPNPAHTKKTYSREHNQRSNQRYGNQEYRHNRRRALERDGYRCAVIENGKRCEATTNLTAHHKIPVGEGGSHALDNLVTACNAHNQKLDAERRRQRERQDRSY